MPKYVCVNKCYHNCELYSPGQVTSFDKNADVPRHFEKASREDSTLDKLRDECNDAGLYYEPDWGIDRLFELLGRESPTKPKPAPKPVEETDQVE